MPILFILLPIQQFYLFENHYLHPVVSFSLDTDILHYINTELQTHYKNIKINKQKQWKEGELCIAQYHHDKKWYRGRIVQENSGNLVQVRNNNQIVLTIFTILFSSYVLYLGGIY